MLSFYSACAFTLFSQTCFIFFCRYAMKYLYCTTPSSSFIRAYFSLILVSCSNFVLFLVDANILKLSASERFRLLEWACANTLLKLAQHD